MRNKKDLDRMFGSFVRYIRDHTTKVSKPDRSESSLQDQIRNLSLKKDTPAGQISADSHRMTRATDELGKEYLCPVSDLKDPDFVREDEKTKCLDYDTLSWTHPG